ncbi:ABA4-like family protein [uncultured Aquimarina sp.]|uniref:ABA4-like family protein n=1 Tax=uncultured Aquimarina sp. TaxID=575652 RepID=UPI00263418DC|nr:ABA4-like family protein [uncultured Aquimarina sp.]
MTTADTFSIANMIAMPMWILMILLPKWKITRFLIDYKIIPIVLSLIYAFYIFQAIQIGRGMDFGSLASVMALFTEENAVLAGWVHYLAFDLMVGMWILDQNKKIGIHQLLIAPCLFATFMLGPIGLLLFLIIKSIKQNKS